jgi:hypothetical protein
MEGTIGKAKTPGIADNFGNKSATILSAVRFRSFQGFKVKMENALLTPPSPLTVK